VDKLQEIINSWINGQHRQCRKQARKYGLKRAIKEIALDETLDPYDKLILIQEIL